MSYNVITGTQQRPQVIIDQVTLQQMQADLGRRIADLERLRVAIETVAAANEPERFHAAAMALCNQLASRWRAERVSLGFLKGRYVRLAALSHTEKFTRQMRLVQDIESAMEECLDQDVEVLFPPVQQATYVSRQTEGLAVRHGPSAVCSLPLRRKGDVKAVLLVERKSDLPFALEEVETLRLTADLVTSRLVNLHEQDRWVGAKAALALRQGLSWAVGTKNTWIKVAAILVFGFITFTVFVEGKYRVESPFTFETVEKRIIPAPFEGYLKSVRVQPGDFVLSEATAARLRELGEPLGLAQNPFAIKWFDSTLATLDTTDIKNKLELSMAEAQIYQEQAKIARRDGKTAEAQVALAQAAKSQAQVDLYTDQIARAVIKAPVDGLVLTGDLRQKLNKRVDAGEELFQVGPIENLRAELDVPEDDIADVKVGAHGQLATASYPGDKIGFTVERINPVAEVVSQHNVFKVRIILDRGELKSWMRPGMEGIAKVDAGRATYGSMWTRRLISWVRMKLWI